MLINPEIRNQTFTTFDTLSGGHYLNDGRDGGDYSSDLRRDSRKRGEDYDDYRKRCMMEAFRFAGTKIGRKRRTLPAS